MPPLQMPVKSFPRSAAAALTWAYERSGVSGLSLGGVTLLPRITFFAIQERQAVYLKLDEEQNGKS